MAAPSTLHVGDSVSYSRTDFDLTLTFTKAEDGVTVLVQEKERTITDDCADMMAESFDNSSFWDLD